jgi:branched-chain amino acid transport system substrate-binding protein
MVTDRSRFRFCVQAAATSLGLGNMGAARSVSRGEIVLGVSLPFTGVLSKSAQQFLEGAKMTFDAANLAGGVHGRKILLEVLDDKFDRTLTLSNAKKLIDRDVLCLFGFMGSPGVLAVSDLLNERQVPLVGATAGSSAAKAARHKYIFIVRATFEQEAEYAVTVGVLTGLKTWAGVYQDDGELATRRGVRSGLAKHQLKPVLEIVFPTLQNADFSDALEQVRRANPSALLYGGGIPWLRAFIQQAKAKQVALPIISVLSAVSPENAVAVLGDDAKGLRFTQPMPYPFNSRLNSSAEYRRLVERFSSQQPSYVGMEGFLSAKLMLRALQQSPSLQRSAIVEALESMRNYRLTEDFSVTFAPNDHAGSSYVDSLMIGRDLHLVR